MPVDHGDEDVPVFECKRRPHRDRRTHGRGQRLVNDAAPVDVVACETDHEPPEPRVTRARALDDDHEPDERRCGSPKDREQRPVDAAHPQVRPRAELELLVGVAPP